MISIRRVYDPPIRGEGRRFLVDRLWPRGIRKEQLGRHRWVPEVAPSPELRLWFGHNPARWRQFQQRYLGELRESTDATAPLLAAARKGPVVLLFAATDRVHNNAVVLRGHLERRLAQPRP
ncbi:MAG: DUF488 domain-containing protein [Acidiferrobacteraceae bacterium]